MIDISFGNQWTQFLDKSVKWNWIVFNLINIELENETYLGSFYIEICLVGFYMRLSWLYDENTPARKELKKLADELEDNPKKHLGSEVETYEKTRSTHKRNTKKNV